MEDAPLEGRRICVLVDHKFIPEEIRAYRQVFSRRGARVDFVSRIWWPTAHPSSQTFYSDVDPLADPLAPPEPLEVSLDISEVRPENYAAVLMSANYTSVRLRWTDPDLEAASDQRAYVQTSPAVQFFSRAMAQHNIVKGALCHGLWILAPHPDLLSKRKVTCHTVVMADVLNTGASVQFVPDEHGHPKPARVVVDGDLVTGYSKGEVYEYIDAITRQILAISYCRGG